MHLFQPEILGKVILILLGILVIVKRFATGSIIDKPMGSFLVQLVNIFNLFFLLVVNPLAAILLIIHRLEAIDPSHVTINNQLILKVLEIVGFSSYLIGFFLMAGALIRLGKNYQPGGSTPRSSDRMIIGGPYSVIRHPRSFCHAILQEFTKGLQEAGHENEVVDLYSIRFDPVFRMDDFASYVHESMPEDILEEMNLRQRVLNSAGGPIKRFIVSRWLHNKDNRAIAQFIHAHRPEDVIAQWDKIG